MFSQLLEKKKSCFFYLCLKSDAFFKDKVLTGAATVTQRENWGLIPPIQNQSRKYTTCLKCKNKTNRREKNSIDSTGWSSVLCSSIVRMSEAVVGLNPHVQRQQYISSWLLI